MSFLTAALIFATLTSATQGQLIKSSWRLHPRGKLINFAQPNMDLQSICYAIKRAYNKGALSDGMGAAMSYFKSKNIPVTMAAKPGSGMSCLYNWANQLGTGGDAGNRFGDFYDTVIEMPQMRGFFQNDPCGDPAFCQCGGSLGLDPPTAMAQMAMPMNDVFAPMGALGVCVKNMICANNPTSMKCVSKVNPLRLGPMGPMMGMMGMMNMNRMNNRAMSAPRLPPAVPSVPKLPPQQPKTDPMTSMLSAMLSNPMMSKFISNPMFAKTFSGIVQQHLAQLQQAAKVQQPVTPVQPVIQPAAQPQQTALTAAQQTFNPLQLFQTSTTTQLQPQQQQVTAFNPLAVLSSMG